jgi:hypothetical protein
MSPEEKAEKKKAEIEAEFARYKLARKMAKAQAEEDEEGTANGGENGILGWMDGMMTSTQRRRWTYKSNWRAKPGTNSSRSKQRAGLGYRNPAVDRQNSPANGTRRTQPTAPRFKSTIIWWKYL